MCSCGGWCQLVMSWLQRWWWGWGWRRWRLSGAGAGAGPATKAEERLEPLCEATSFWSSRALHGTLCKAPCQACMRHGRVDPACCTGASPAGRENGAHCSTHLLLKAIHHHARSQHAPRGVLCTRSGARRLTVWVSLLGPSQAQPQPLRQCPQQTTAAETTAAAAASGQPASARSSSWCAQCTHTGGRPSLPALTIPSVRSTSCWPAASPAARGVPAVPARPGLRGPPPPASLCSRAARQPRWAC